MSRTRGIRAVVDAGLKPPSVDSGLPQVVTGRGASTRVSDEHGVIELVGVANYALRENLELISGHCNSTAKLHDYNACLRGERVEAVWPITARGCLR